MKAFTDDTVDLLGKVASDLQEDVAISDRTFYGTSKYVTGYTGFSGDPAEQEGNYIVLQAEATNATAIKAEIIGGTSGEVTLDEDGILIAHLKDTATAVKFTAVDADGDDKVVTISLEGLTREEA